MKRVTGVDFQITTKRRRSIVIRRHMAATDRLSRRYLALLREPRRRRSSGCRGDSHLRHLILPREQKPSMPCVRSSDGIIGAESDGESIRVWIAGCATGEEAYSVAIVFLEAMQHSGRALKLQVFATDIDATALAHARRGVFSQDQLIRVSEDRARRYFQSYRSRRCGSANRCANRSCSRCTTSCATRHSAPRSHHLPQRAHLLQARGAGAAAAPSTVPCGQRTNLPGTFGNHPPGGPAV